MPVPKQRGNTLKPNLNVPGGITKGQAIDAKLSALGDLLKEGYNNYVSPAMDAFNNNLNSVFVKPFMSAYDAAESAYEKYTPNTVKRTLSDYNRMPNMPSPGKAAHAFTATQDILDYLPKIASEAKLAAKLLHGADVGEGVAKAATMENIFKAAQQIGPEGLKIQDMTNPMNMLLQRISDSYDAMRKSVKPGSIEEVRYAKLPPTETMGATLGDPISIKTIAPESKHYIPVPEKTFHNAIATAGNLTDWYSPTTAIYQEHLPPGSFGYANHGSKSIHVSDDYQTFIRALESGKDLEKDGFEVDWDARATPFRKLVDNVGHEDRHLYQGWYNPHILDNPVRGRDDFAGYYRHPAEVDARWGGSQVVAKYKNLVESLYPDIEPEINETLQNITPFMDDLFTVAGKAGVPLDRTVQGLTDLKNILKFQYGRLNTVPASTHLPQVQTALLKVLDRVLTPYSPQHLELGQKYGLFGGRPRTPFEQDAYHINLLDRAFELENPNFGNK